MFEDTPKLREPVLSGIAASIFILSGWWATRYPDGLRAFFIMVGVIFALATAVKGLDWFLWAYAMRIENIQRARVSGAVQYAMALKGLTMSQTDMVQRQISDAIMGIPGDDGPVWYIRGHTVDIPLEFAVDFFEWSKQSAPYLWPVRRGAEVGGGNGWSNGVQYAQELTRSIIVNGWAKKAGGPYSAILVDDLPVVARRYGVEV